MCRPSWSPLADSRAVLLTGRGPRLSMVQQRENPSFLMAFPMLPAERHISMVIRHGTHSPDQRRGQAHRALLGRMRPVPGLCVTRDAALLDIWKKLYMQNAGQYNNLYESPTPREIPSQGTLRPFCRSCTVKTSKNNAIFLYRAKH